MTDNQQDNSEPRPRKFPGRRITFAVIGLLLPPIGAIVAVYLLTKKEPAEQQHGRFALMWSALGLLGYLIHHLLTR